MAPRSATSSAIASVALHTAGGVAAFVLMRWALERKSIGVDPIELVFVAVIAVAISIGRTVRPRP